MMEASLLHWDLMYHKETYFPIYWSDVRINAQQRKWITLRTIYLATNQALPRQKSFAVDLPSEIKKDRD